MDTSYLNYHFSLSVLLSYVFDLLSSRYKTPSVILLLASGMLMRQVTNYLRFQLPYVDTILPTLGHAGADSNRIGRRTGTGVDGEKLGMIRRASGVAVVHPGHVAAHGFAVLRADGSVVFQVSGCRHAVCCHQQCRGRSGQQQPEPNEPGIYRLRSSLSDILGVMIFNFLVYNASGVFCQFCRLPKTPSSW